MYQQQFKFFMSCASVRICCRPGEERRVRLGNATSASQNQGRTHGCATAAPKAQDSKAQKNLEKSRDQSLLRKSPKRMAAPEQREAYSSEHAISDLNSADAIR